MYEARDIRTDQPQSTRYGWYLAQLKPNCASIASRNLERQGIRSFMPLETRTVPRGGRFVDKPYPVFSGYLFVRLDKTAGQWRAVGSTYGISRLVSFGQEPATVPECLIDGLIDRCDNDGFLVPNSDFSAGDGVKVTDGPLIDFLGVIEKVSPDRRAFVLMEIMGQTTKVEVDAGSLRKLV